MLIPMTKKEFNILLAILTPIVVAGLIVIIVLITNKYNDEMRYNYVSDEARAKLDEWKKISNATQKLVSPELWMTAENDARLLGQTVEEDVTMSVYANYYTDSGMYSTIVAAGTLDGLDTKVDRQIAEMMFRHKIASSSVVNYYGEENIEASGVILSWEHPEDEDAVVYSLIDINGDGSWDYIARGKEGAYFDTASGVLSYTDDVGNMTYATAEEYREVVSPHVTLSEAEKLF